MEKDKRKALRRHIDIHAVEKSPNSTQFEYKKHRETTIFHKRSRPKIR